MEALKTLGSSDLLFLENLKIVPKKLQNINKISIVYDFFTHLTYLLHTAGFVEIAEMQ